VAEYAVVIEEAGDGFSAYVPDLPGCVSVGASVDETITNIRVAVGLHIASLREHGEEVPPPTSRTTTVEVA
jgi:predicted RNase H-like HicB family nuclease